MKNYIIHFKLTQTHIQSFASSVNGSIVNNSQRDERHDSTEAGVKRIMTKSIEHYYEVFDQFPDEIRFTPNSIKFQDLKPMSEILELLVNQAVLDHKNK